MIDQQEKFKRKGIGVKFVGEAQTDERVVDDAVNNSCVLALKAY